MQICVYRPTYCFCSFTAATVAYFSVNKDDHNYIYIACMRVTYRVTSRRANWSLPLCRVFAPCSAPSFATSSRDSLPHCWPFCTPSPTPQLTADCLGTGTAGNKPKECLVRYSTPPSLPPRRRPSVCQVEMRTHKRLHAAVVYGELSV